MKVLHVCNWVGGITTRNVNALKQFSKHQHEIVARVNHCYEMATEPAQLTEKNTTRKFVLELAEEADVLHFHAVGYDGSSELPETIHGIDWSQFLGKKIFALHGMVSYLGKDGLFTRSNGWAASLARFTVKNLGHYQLLMGPHLSCKLSYEDRLEYVPDIIPIGDWLYRPTGSSERLPLAATFKEPWLVERCAREGLKVQLLPTPMKLPEQLAWRRRYCKVTFDNSTDGHWGLFGVESLSQGIPCVAYTHPVNRVCWKVLDSPDPPFLECQYGGSDVPELVKRVFDMPELEWEGLSSFCRAWVEKYYNPQRLVARWDAVYDRSA